VSVFAVTDDSEAAAARSQIAFYASTPAYRVVMETHGWGDTADALSGLARRGAWNEMAGCITDEMLQSFAVVAPAEELAASLRTRYNGLADRLMLYLPFRPGERDDFWRRLIKGLKS